MRSSGLLTPEELSEDGTAPTDGTYVNGTDGEAKKKGTRNAEDVARLVYGFVKSAGGMIEQLNGENDEAKLLRVRTKKNELVVVPGMLGVFVVWRGLVLMLSRRQVLACCDT